MGGAASPAQSDVSQGSGKYAGDHDESSNEALVVDCDSPSRSNTPGKLNIIIYPLIGSNKLSVYAHQYYINTYNVFVINAWMLDMATSFLSKLIKKFFFYIFV